MEGEGLKEQETRIFVVRHGETQWNLERRIQGHRDSPLSPLGLRQARALGDRLSDARFDAIISSDLGRAMDTARAAVGPHPPIQADPRLRERNMGVLQGLTADETQATLPEIWAAFTGDDPDAPIPEGESVRQYHQRCADALDDIARTHRGQRVLTISHGGVLRAWFKHVVGLPLISPRRFSVINASLGEIASGPTGLKLRSWGLVEHLDDLGYIPL